MKIKIKKILSLVLSILFVTSLMSENYVAYAETGVKTFAELVEAINNKEEIITLASDIEISDKITIDHNVTINGNDHKLLRTNDYLGVMISVENASEEIVSLTLNKVIIDGQSVEANAQTISLNSNTNLIGKDCQFINCRNNGEQYSWQSSYWTWKDGKSVKVTQTYYGYRNSDGGVIYSNEANITLDNCTFENNYAKGSGAAIYLKYADLSLTNCSFTSCDSDYNGGAIYAYSNDGNILSIDKSSFTKNSSSNNGGAILMEYFDEVSISNSTFTENKVGENGYGGALYIERCGDTSIRSEKEAENTENWVIITDTTLSKNIAKDGGAMDVYGSLVKLCGNTTICSNSATGKGGAIVSSEVGMIFMYDKSIVCHNHSDKSGGGIYQDELEVFMHDDSSICYNEAESNGGGVYVGYDLLKMYDNASIHNNVAGENGGGIYCEDETWLIDSMIYDNTAVAEGDDVYNDLRYGLPMEYLLVDQKERIYGEGNSTALGTVLVEQISGYPYACSFEDNIYVPYYGWFQDDDDSLYTNVMESTLIKDTFQVGDEESINNNYYGYKAIWYGLVVCYDANDGSKQYKYDQQAYVVNSNVEVKDNMFVRDGYKFIGWNTESDGSGISYSSEDILSLDKSIALYAQWEKIPTQPATGDNSNIFMNLTLSCLSLSLIILAVTQKKNFVK